MKRCKNDGEKMQKCYLTEHILSPLIRGGSKAGGYLTEHKDTKYFDERRMTRNKGQKVIVIVKKNSVSLCLCVQI